MWVQHIVCPTVIEEEKKDPSHDQNGVEPSWYLCFKDIHNSQNGSRVSFPHRQSRRSALPPVALGLGGGSRSLAGGGFIFFLFRLFFSVFFDVVRSRYILKLE
jgi:hypothetical protein